MSKLRKFLDLLPYFNFILFLFLSINIFIAKGINNLSSWISFGLFLAALILFIIWIIKDLKSRRKKHYHG